MSEVRTRDKALALAKIIGAGAFILVVVVGLVGVLGALIDVAIGGEENITPVVVGLAVIATVTLLVKLGRKLWSSR